MHGIASPRRFRRVGDTPNLHAVEKVLGARLIHEAARHRAIILEHVLWASQKSSRLSCEKPDCFASTGLGNECSEFESRKDWENAGHIAEEIGIICCIPRIKRIRVSLVPEHKAKGKLFPFNLASPDPYTLPQ